MRWLVTTLVVAMLVVGAGSGAVAVTGRPAAGPGAVLPAPRTVTLAEDGQTLALRVGETFLLALGGPPPVWRVTVADPGVLARQPNVLVVRGAQGIYRALAPGTTRLEAVATYPCPAPYPVCRTPLRRVFRITVVVGG